VCQTYTYEDVCNNKILSIKNTTFILKPSQNNHHKVTEFYKPQTINITNITNQCTRKNIKITPRISRYHPASSSPFCYHKKNEGSILLPKKVRVRYKMRIFERISDWVIQLRWIQRSNPGIKRRASSLKRLTMCIRNKTSLLIPRMGVIIASLKVSNYRADKGHIVPILIPKIIQVCYNLLSGI